jgi:ABC-type Zn uptake system ZnuABC Zn-binding protein ZnuA
MILLFITSFACQRTERGDIQNNHTSEKKLRVLTTIPALYSFTINVTGDAAEVENLLPSGAGPHHYSFRPTDIRKITKAHVLIKNGVNLETWLDNLVQAADTKTLLIVDTSAHVDIINADPHIWLSPKNAIIQVNNITSALAKVDHQNSDIYKTNAEQYIHRLEILDREIQREVKNWKSKEFVALHSAFSYFTKDYGLKQVAAIRESPEKEPSPRHIAGVMKTIKERDINAIFSEQLSPSRIIRTLAKDLHLEVYRLDTMETGTLHSGWYEDSIRANVAVLKKALHEI